MITPGMEWQARELADAADIVNEAYRVGPGLSDEPRADLSAAYCQGAADVLRLIIGDLTDDMSGWPDALQLIHGQYVRNI